MSPRNSPERRRRRRLSSPTATATTSMPAPAEIGPAVSLPDDIVFDIFSRLPVKSVCRFRCLSRAWHALISDPAFIAAHRSHPAEPYFVVFARICGGGYRLRLVDMDGTLVRVIRDVSCYGLRSTSTSDLICVTREGYDFAQVIDPADGTVLLDWPKQHVGQYLGSEKYYHIFGFGRAVPSGSYKMVRLSSLPDCKVLTLGDSIRWRPAQLPPTQHYINRSTLVVVNGVLYMWVSRKECNGELLCFDLETEQWKKIESPQEVVGPEVWGTATKLVSITELNDTLCVVQSEMLKTNIWLLNDSDKNIWTKTYTIPILCYTYPMPLKVTHDRERLILCCLSHDEKSLVIQVYDPHNNARSELPRLGGADAMKIGLCSVRVPLHHFVSSKI
ncbi:unnamed protein product [Alopecurus aequalis]